MTDLETLLRNTELRHGRICLYTDKGEWFAAVTHFHGHQTHLGGETWHSDPVDALRAALVEDDRKSRDIKRRYTEAPKKGAVQDDDFGSMFELSLIHI